MSSKTYRTTTVRDYNLVVALLKEHNLPLLQVHTSTGDINDTDEFSITSEGNENLLNFVEYLFKKEQKKLDEAIAKIGIKD